VTELWACWWQTCSDSRRYRLAVLSCSVWHRLAPQHL